VKKPSLTKQNADLRCTNAQLLSACGVRNEEISKLQRENRDLAERVRMSLIPLRMDTIDDVRAATDHMLMRMRHLNQGQAIHLLNIVASAFNIVNVATKDPK